MFSESEKLELKREYTDDIKKTVIAFANGDGKKYIELLSSNQDLSFEYTENVFKENNIEFNSKKYSTLGITDINGLYTNLGLLLSNENKHNIKVAIFQGNDMSVFRDRKEFGDSIFEQLENVLNYLDFYNKTYATIEGLKRNDKRDYSSKAIRESILNAIIHRDYSFSGSILIRLFDNRLEIMSLGGLVNNLSLDAISQGISQSRNEKLANIFYRLKLVESYGTGIPNIFSEYKDEPIKPKIKITDSSFLIILPNRNYKNDEKKENNSINEDSMFVDMQHKKVVDLIKKYNVIKKEQIMTELKISIVRAYQIINKMISKKIIRKIKVGKSSYYQLN